MLLESTYGDRKHPPFDDIDDELIKIVTGTLERKGRVLIPTFALERAQEVLFALSRLQREGRLQPMPIYIDSPLAISITEIYKLHPESLDPGIRVLLENHAGPFSPPGLTYVSSVEDSRALQNSGEPCVIIAGSGMCEGGRILFHLNDGVGNPKNSVVIVGFMAQHTLGRRLAERRSSVRILGVERDVHSHVHVLEGLSAHADQDDLITFTKQVAAAGDLRRLALVHGERDARSTLAGLIAEQMPGLKAMEPKKGDVLQL
jgi:metallo-beta-lactamase family protein